MGVPCLNFRTGSKFAFVIRKAVSIMQTEKASEGDIQLMDRTLREARTDLAYGGAGVAALLASPDQIIAVAFNP